MLKSAVTDAFDPKRKSQGTSSIRPDLRRQRQTTSKDNIAEPNVLPKLKVGKTSGSRPNGAKAMRNSKKARLGRIRGPAIDGGKEMKQVIKLTMLAVGMMTAFASLPAQAAQVCVPGRGCVRTTQAAYNSCFELSQARGVSEQMNRAERWFIYQCLKGRIPR
jgi:hypothetical protein